IELIELELRELLTRYEFPGDEVPIVRGNALAALASGGKDDAACRCIDDLMHALDTYLPVPPRDEDRPFLMSVEHVHRIDGRGTVATGLVECGRIRVGDEVEILGLRKDARRTVVTGVEAFRRPLAAASAGENVGVLLRGVKQEEVERGQVLAAPGSIT